jgi:hypothetical protein
MSDMEDDDDSGEIVDSGEQEADAQEEHLGSGSQLESAEAAEQAQTFRVQEDIHGRVPVWKGVSDCHQAESAMRAFQPVYDAWVAATIAGRPNNTPIAKGYRNFAYRWENRTTQSGRRKCKGVCTSVIVYVDFA